MVLFHMEYIFSPVKKSLWFQIDVNRLLEVSFYLNLMVSFYLDPMV